MPTRKGVSGYQPIAGNLRRVDGIAHVVPRTVAHKGNQPFIDILDIGLQHPAILGLLVHDAGYDGNHELHDIEIGLFVESTYIIYLTRAATLQHGIDSLGMVFHIEPVADILALAIDRELLPGQDIRIISGISFSGK